MIPNFLVCVHIPVMIYDIHLILDVLSIDIHAMQINHAPKYPAKIASTIIRTGIFNSGGLRLRDVCA